MESIQEDKRTLSLHAYTANLLHNCTVIDSKVQLVDTGLSQHQTMTFEVPLVDIALSQHQAMVAVQMYLVMHICASTIVLRQLHQQVRVCLASYLHDTRPTQSIKSKEVLSLHTHASRTVLLHMH